MIVEELLRLPGPVHHLIVDAGDVENQPHHQAEACTPAHHTHTHTRTGVRKETSSDDVRQAGIQQLPSILMNKSKQHNK